MQNKEIITALKKANTHLSNVIKMVEDGKYCIDILQQNLAVIGLLKSANGNLMKRHLNSCFVSVMQGTDKKKKEKMVDEILAINRLNK